MHRDDHLARIVGRRDPFDLVVIGGGASGLGTALDAATRGLDVALLEATDFGKGTSSRSTKLIHGGVRYLQQGNLSLVRESLHERTRLLNNAPHLVHPLEFILPCRSRWESCYYGLGMKLYDWLAGKSAFKSARGLTRQTVLGKLPGLRDQRLFAGIAYYDGQFDDSRLLVSLAQTAAEAGATLLNAARVTELIQSAGRLEQIVFRDEETQALHAVRGRCFVNATGPFCDNLRQLDQPECRRLVAASQGIHLVLPPSFFPGTTALIVPKTSDGRVMFVIPWHGHVLLGTTDTPIPAACEEPQALEEEIEFLLKTAGEYLIRAPGRSDCLSVFVGIRPLVNAQGGGATKALSRDHTIEVSGSGLITLTGGKWTTYRQMAEDCVDRVIKTLGVVPRPSQTHSLRLRGAPVNGGQQWGGSADHGSVYGVDQQRIDALVVERPELSRQLHRALPYRAVEVVWAVRHEWARTVEDVLARRTRALFLNATAAIAMAPDVAQLMALELGRDSAWCAQQVTSFNEIAAKYFP